MDGLRPSDTGTTRFALALCAGALLVACAGEGGGEGAARGPEGGSAATVEPSDSLPAWCRELPRPAYDSLSLAFRSEDGWYRVYRIRPGVHAIYEPDQFQEVISYVVEGEERALLVDTGMGIAPIRPVVERITDRPVTVVNTHTHPDHVGGNHSFERVLAYDTAFTGRHARVGFSHQRMQGQVAPAALCRSLPTGTERGEYRIRPWSASGSVTGGDLIDLGGRRVEVLHVPGHTPDGLAFLDRDHGLLFTGDNLYRGPIYLFSEETDLDAYARSMARLARLVPSLDALLPGHNTPVEPPGMVRRVAEGIEAVRAGRVGGRSEEGRTVYTFEDFTLLLPGPDEGAP